MVQQRRDRLDLALVVDALQRHELVDPRPDARQRRQRHEQLPGVVLEHGAQGVRLAVNDVVARDLQVDLAGRAASWRAAVTVGATLAGRARALASARRAGPHELVALQRLGIVVEFVETQLAELLPARPRLRRHEAAEVEVGEAAPGLALVAAGAIRPCVRGAGHVCRRRYARIRKCATTGMGLCALS